MSLLNQNTRDQLTQIFTPLQNNVSIIVVDFASDSEHVRAAGSLEQVNSLLEEVAELSPKISIEYLELSPEEAANMGIALSPTLLFREEGSQRTNIRFVGAPIGYEFSSFINAVALVGGIAETIPGEKLSAQLAEVNGPVILRCFVTPSCHFCPPAVMAAYRLAYFHADICAEVVEASQFYEFSSQYNVSSVPDTFIFTGEQATHLVGAHPENALLSSIHKLQTEA